MAERLRDRFPTAHRVIVGDGPERATIEAEIAKRGLTDQIHLLGTRHDTTRILSALDRFTFCSHNEASPVSIIEAFACEIPVVAADVGSVAETVIEGQNRPTDRSRQSGRVLRSRGKSAAERLHSWPVW